MFCVVSIIVTGSIWSSITVGFEALKSPWYWVGSVPSALVCGLVLKRLLNTHNSESKHE